MKIGIITHYYRSQNYGGTLQAYALCFFLKGKGYAAEQIQFDRNKDIGLIPNLRTAYHKLRELPSSLHLEPKYKRVHQLMRERAGKFEAFRNDAIPHSAQVFSPKTIKYLPPNYDVFIAGSDQVWHPSAVCDAYLLKLGTEKSIKISYAASVATDVLSAYDQARYQAAFSDFQAISVRESNAIELIQPLSPTKVEWVLDPTLLLVKNDWDEICAERMVNQPYLFCYFLGADIEERELAKAYAKRKGLKLVTMPFLLREMLLQRDFRKYESSFGDEQLYDVSPEHFLSLIKYASCVFTDSFHAALFSGVFRREYFIFGRGEMNSRITSLTKLYETEERFCNTPERRTIEYILAQKPIDYTRELTLLHDMQQKSKDFLKDNLEKAERQLNGI